jgi:RsiW-degrading membrane proteinase PrsW (M82 family)
MDPQPPRALGLSPVALAPAATLTIATGNVAAETAATGRGSGAELSALPLTQPVTHIGALGSNDIILRDPQVSRLHAVVRRASDGYVIEDLQSSSGTYIGGRRIVAPTILAHGDRIGIGGVVLVFQAQPAAPTPVPAPLTLAAPVGSPPESDASATLTPLYRARLLRWLKAQAPKSYWRIFVVGLLAYVICTVILYASSDLILVPTVILLGSALVPVTFLCFCWEEGAFRDMPAATVGLAFISGATLGIGSAVVLEVFVFSAPGAFAIAAIEEAVKAAALVWFLRDRRLRSELDGLVLGAAAGVGFSTLETAGYAFYGFLQGATTHFFNAFWTSGGATMAQMMAASVAFGFQSMTHTLIVRGLFGLGSHGVWTAIVGAAIWRERGTKVFRFTPGVALAFVIAATLHGLWDTVSLSGGNILWLVPLTAVGLWILRFFIHEAVDRAKLGSLAPPPAPLGRSLIMYLRHPFRRPVGEPRAAP